MSSFWTESKYTDSNFDISGEQNFLTEKILVSNCVILTDL